jgi:tetratricopeptide (TPR) repeat protein
LNNIGSVYYSKGDYNKALENYNKCFEINTKIKGADSIDVAGTLSNIGSVYYSKGDYNKALENYNKCLEINTKIKGADSIDVAQTLKNINLTREKIHEQK